MVIMELFNPLSFCLLSMPQLLTIDDRRMLKINGSSSSPFPFHLHPAPPHSHSFFDWWLSSGSVKGWLAAFTLLSVPTPPREVLLLGSPGLSCLQPDQSPKDPGQQKCLPGTVLFYMADLVMKWISWQAICFRHLYLESLCYNCEMYPILSLLPGLASTTCSASTYWNRPVCISIWCLN